MALFDIFKRKKKEEVMRKEKEPARPSPKKSLKVKGERKTDIAYRVLEEPHVTEKATNLVGQNQYVFKVFPRANKVEIKKVVSALYGVDVISVKIIKIPKKKRRLGKVKGWRKGYKKAIVKIKEGQKIEILPR